MRFAFKWMLRLAILAAFLVAASVVGAAVNARSRVPDLKPWHRLVPAAEVHARDVGPDFTLDQYLAREQKVFEQVRAEIEDRLAPEERLAVNRYDRGGRASPSRLSRDWNRTFEMAAPAPAPCAVLLIHGLTDSPYSMRAIAERLHADGCYVLAPRMPGHGAVPGGLTDASWPDWNAVVRLGVRHLRARAGAGVPLTLIGYSNGGALSVKYALDAIEDSSLPRADRLVLISPMIGVSAFAGLARLVGALGVLPYFEKTKWLDVIPEYNPFKFNSFPTHAAVQTAVLTAALQRQVDTLAADGRLAGMPPVLTFQSLVDATVDARAVVTQFHAKLPANGSELVVFDINRLAGLDPFMRSSDRELLNRLMQRSERRFRLTVMTNLNQQSLNLVARSGEAGVSEVTETPTDLAWPSDTFSLSHIALPFSPSDPVYGRSPDESLGAIVHLGTLSPRGERDVLVAPVDVLMRVSSNPFYSYLEQRAVKWVARR
ncbi:MAG TPA: alpha/beta fold hydrolase [Vicinamibacterales bacterium]|nr:alpha/beta fold hydrolase [Vicinamibacterales bacterium]